MRRLRTALLAAVLGIGLTGVTAAADDMNVTVMAQVGNYCLFDSGTDLNFGTVSPGDVVGAVSEIRWTCSAGTTWVLSDDNNFGVEDGTYTGTMSNLSLDTLDFSFIYTPTSGTSSGAQEVSNLLGSLTVPLGQPTGSYVAFVTFRIEP